MKTRKLHGQLIWVLFFFSISSEKLKAQDATSIPIIHATSDKASIRSGETFRKDSWTISAEYNPDTWTVLLKDNKPTRATLITDMDSISYLVETNESYEFHIVLNQTDTILTRIVGCLEAATFTEAYKASNSGKTLIEIPEVYELVNVVIAMTSISQKEEMYLVHKESDYYQSVLNYFDDYKNEEIVQTVNDIITENQGMYFGLKMDAYAFELQSNKIVKKSTYDRIAQTVGEVWWTEDLLEALETFYYKTNFTKFYKESRNLYHEQIDYMANNVNISQMQSWLNTNFVGTRYDCYKIIFSPLVGWNQSAKWFDNNGFKEAQAHVNFPYPAISDKQYSKEANALRDGSILFTEMNHAYINPEVEQYLVSEVFIEAFKDLSFWLEEGKPASQYYNNAYSCFNELMNWSLVCLYYADFAPKEELEKMVQAVQKNQVENRGFKHFSSFSKTLIDLYRNRKDGETIADLYPDILKWCYTQVTLEAIKASK